jgi:hypothetical protein
VFRDNKKMQFYNYEEEESYVNPSNASMYETVDIEN